MIDWLQIILLPKMPFFVSQKVKILANFIKSQHFRHDCQFSSFRQCFLSERNLLEPINGHWIYWCLFVECNVKTEPRNHPAWSVPESEQTCCTKLPLFINFLPVTSSGSSKDIAKVSNDIGSRRKW